MEQIAVLEVFRRHIGMILALSVISTLATYGFSFLMVERYTGSALVLVRPQQPIEMDDREISKNLFDFPVTQSMSVETPSKTYIEVIKSQELIAKVVRALHLDADAPKGGGFLYKYLPAALADKVLQWKEDAVAFTKDLVSMFKYGRVIHNDPVSAAVAEVQENLSASSVEDAFVFNIKYSGRSPQQAADVANMIAQSFIDYMEQVRLSEAENVRDHLRVKLDQSRLELLGARERMEQPRAVASALRDTKLQELVVEAAQTAYQTVTREFKQADINVSYPLPEVRLVSQAAPDVLPTGPARLKFAGVALFGGAVAGIGLALFLEYINHRIRGIADVEAFIGVKVLGTVPRVSQLRWRTVGRQLKRAFRA